MRFCGKQYGLLGALLLALQLYGQQPHYYNIQQYGADDGFQPWQTTHSITTDREGFVWIGSDNGLYQFDGKFFRQYTHRSSREGALPSSLVHYNYQDRSGRYWVYVYTKGLYNFLQGKGEFVKFRAADSTAFNIHNYELAMPFEDSRGRLWFPALGYGIVRYDAAANRLQPYKICFPGNCTAYRSASWVNKILEDPADGSFWLCTNRGLVHFFPESGKYELFLDEQFRNRNTGEEGTCITGCFDAQQQLWLGTWSQGIKKFNRITKEFDTWLPNPAFLMGTKNICNGIAPRSSTSLWVSSIDAGMLIFDMKTGGFSPVAGISRQAGFTSVSSFQAMADGSVWFCSDKKLCKLNPVENIFPFHPLVIDRQPGNNKSLVSCFASSGGKLYTGAYYSGRLFEYNLQTSEYRGYNLPGSNAGYAITGIAADPAGNIWMATGSGFFMFNPKANRIVQPVVASGDGSAINAWCTGAAVDAAGIVWVSSLAGLMQYNPQTRQMRLFHGAATANAELLTVACAPDGRVWVGAGTLGLGCLQKGDSNIVYFNRQRNAAYPQFNCASIAFLKNGAILFTQQGEGLYMLERPFTAQETLTGFTSADALPLDIVKGLLVDNRNRVWVYSNAGISLLDMAARSSITFTQKEGFMETSFESNPWQDEAGFLYVGSTEGFQRFHPDTILKTMPVTTRIHFSDFRVNGQSRMLWPTEANHVPPLRLGPGEGNISFRFAALSTGFSNLLRYSYRLKGYDKEWIETIKNETAYNNLPSGRYELQIRTGLINQRWSDTWFTMPVIIERPWYRQPWFTGLCVLTGLLLLYGLYRFRIRTLKEKLRMKAGYDKRISEIEMKALRAQMNPHFIFNCLNSINRYIVKSDSKTASGYLTKFSKLIRLILDNSASETIPVEKEIETLRLYIDMEALRFDHVFDYSITTEEGLQGTEMEIPSMLIQPYVENAIWHGLLHLEGRRGMLQIHFSHPHPGRILVTVEDNGIGRDKAADLRTRDALKRKSYGMQITSDRIHLMNRLHNLNASVRIADLHDESGAAAGTRVYIEIPVKE